MRGKTEASTMRSRPALCTRKRLSTTEPGSLAGTHRQLHDAWWPHAWSRIQPRNSSRSVRRVWATLARRPDRRPAS